MSFIWEVSHQRWGRNPQRIVTTTVTSRRLCKEDTKQLTENSLEMIPVLRNRGENNHNTKLVLLPKSRVLNKRVISKIMSLEGRQARESDTYVLKKQYIKYRYFSSQELQLKQMKKRGKEDRQQTPTGNLSV